MTGAATDSPATSPGTSGWEVRPARPEDAAAVATGVAALLCELGATPPSHAAIEAEAKAHIDDPSLGIVLIATAASPSEASSHLATTDVDNCELTGGGELVGVLTASWARAIQVPGRMLTIEVLWTRREWRGRAVGAGLVDALAPLAVEAGAARVEVGLPRESFDAIRATERFYLANGFERLGPRMRRTFT
jgi:GNAT superfamily N-acetyltransferase